MTKFCLIILGIICGYNPLAFAACDDHNETGCRPVTPTDFQQQALGAANQAVVAPVNNPFVTCNGDPQCISNYYPKIPTDVTTTNDNSYQNTTIAAPAPIYNEIATPSTEAYQTNSIPLPAAPLTAEAFSACQSKAQAAITECQLGGVGAAAAQGLQKAAGTTINIGQSANAACEAQKQQALSGMEGTGLIDTLCTRAATECLTACGSSTNPTMQENLTACRNARTAATIGLGTNMLQAAMGFLTGGNCAAQTTDNAPTGAMPQDPGYNPPNGTQPGGLMAGLPPSPGSTPNFLPTDGAGGSGAAGNTAGYPNSGAGAEKQAPPSGLPTVALSLGGGTGGGGWPTSPNHPGAAVKLPPGINPADLMAAMMQNKRDLASVSNSEITGPNDLTNFQKVTRMMSKKRPAMKSAD